MLAEPLRGRVHFFATRYRHAHDSEGRGWITIDGVEICDMSTLRAFAEQHRLAARATGRDEKTAWDDWGSVLHDQAYWEAWHHAEAERKREGVLAAWDFTGTLWQYLQRPFEEVLNSDDILSRALAILDRRLGRRRFLELHLRPDEHPLVRTLYHFRGEVEGWLARPDA